MIGLKIHRKEISVLDPLIADKNWSDKSIQKVYRVCWIITKTKFGKNNAAKLNIPAIRQHQLWCYDMLLSRLGNKW